MALEAAAPLTWPGCFLTACVDSRSLLTGPGSKEEDENRKIGLSYGSMIPPRRAGYVTAAADARDMGEVSSGKTTTQVIIIL